MTTSRTVFVVPQLLVLLFLFVTALPAWAQSNTALEPQEFEPLPELYELPEFITTEVILGLLPKSVRADEEHLEEFRTRLEAHFNKEFPVLYGGYLDPEKSIFVLWLDDNSLTQYVGLYYGTKRTQRLVLSRSRAHLKDIVGSPISELVVQEITSMSVCCIPVDLVIYGLDSGKRLREIMRYAQTHYLVGPGIEYYFINHFEFGKDEILIRQVFPEDPRLVKFVYNPQKRRFAPSKESRAVIRSLEKERHIE